MKMYMAAKIRRLSGAPLRSLLLLLLPAALAGCSSVEVPIESFYRLELPAMASPDPERAGTLRVHDLRLGTAMDSDRLLRQDGVRLEPWPLTRWVAPLDRLISDALVLGLSRARVCDLVKGSADSGTETWSLHGRILEFVEAEGDRGLEARVTIELWLQSGEQLVFHDEFAHVEPIAAGDEEPASAAVASLSRGLNHIVGDVVARMRQLDLFAAAKSARNDSPAAAPGR